MANAAALASAIQAQTQIAARIAEITLSANPDYSVAGRSFSKGTYLTQLNQELERVTRLIQVLSGPFTVVSRGVT